ncbi:DUF4160 domain-containing protein [Euzebya sp.]|uniref:DUF4160 domain-containing protein n=1 Tax=Euzebya sp. TaxID=1971409 RepID=UPI003519C807
MSPRWHAIEGASLDFYFNETHQRPHVAVRGAGWSCTVALDSMEVLASSGRPPARVMAAVIDLLGEHRDLAVRAFFETAAHRFPGTLEEMKEAEDDGPTSDR